MMETSLIVPEDMRGYIAEGLTVTHFIIVYDESDVFKGETSLNHFKPDYCHQVYGDKELIFGYKDLQVYLYYLHNSALCYLDIQHSDIFVSNRTELQADDIHAQISLWYPSGIIMDRAEFLQMVLKENHLHVYGHLEEEFLSLNKDKVLTKFQVQLCSIDQPGFEEFHHRFESFIVWFIDEANPIDTSDRNWMIVYLYEEIGYFKPIRTPVGYCTVYKFYQFEAKVRARISQFFILPTHQRLGLGSKFYAAVCRLIKKVVPNLVDITVEKPCDAFNSLRDQQDCILAMELDCLRPPKITSRYDKSIAKMIRSELKVSRQQSLKLYDIFYLLHINDIQSYNHFELIVKQNNSKYYKKQYLHALAKLNFNDENWRCINLADPNKPLAIRFCKKYIDLLAPTVSFLKNYLGWCEDVQKLEVENYEMEPGPSSYSAEMLFCDESIPDDDEMELSPSDSQMET